MMVKFKLFANFREATRQKEVEITVEKGTVSAAIEALAAKYPGLGPLLYQDGQLKKYVNVLLNGQPVPQSQLSAGVRDGDEIALFPPVSGG